MDLSVKITGVDTMVDRLSKLADKVQRTEARKAARKGAIVMRNAARQNFRAANIDDPDTRENIGKNIAVQESRRGGKAAAGIMMRVGILGGARQYAGTKANVRKGRAGKTYAVGGTLAKVGGGPGGDTFYWRFHEFGAPGRNIKARPFMRPAFAQTPQTATDAVALALNFSLDTLT
jgi:HK97 gp10 family phage protein